jgi:DNA-binding CsgD family transcriptional regulator
MADINDLSEREQEILYLVAKGASNKQIAQELYISTNTVKVHLRNIFSKIDVASRTEAAMYAVSVGLVEPVESPDREGLAVKVTDSADDLVTKETLRSELTFRKWWTAAAIFGIVVITFVGILYVWERNNDNSAFSSNFESVEQSRWQEKAAMITARSGFGITTYAEQIFAIAGETDHGISDVTEKYDPNLDEWISLASKGEAVTDISSVAIGGLIYIPGGRQESGKVIDILEVYEPAENRWFERAPMPTPLSAYTLVSFEGKLYMFGGWDGKKYVSTAYEYDPTLDRWVELPPMKTTRGYAGGAVAGGKVYVIGGINETGILDTNEVYMPGQLGENGNPWSLVTPLPEPRYAMGVASVADIIHIIGGIGQKGAELYSLAYYPNSDRWEKFVRPFDDNWSNLGLASLESQLFAIGGIMNEKITNLNFAYQAIFTVLFPVVK